MTRLGVNIDHVATLRQARGTPYPSVVRAAGICEAAGAAGITVHLREDRRHIQDADVYALRERLRVPLNLEMAVAEDIVRIALDVRPDEVCLVPEKRQELTTEGGLDAAGTQATLAPVVEQLQAAGIRVSLFIDPDVAQLDAALAVGAPVVELHTGTYCDVNGAAREAELARLVEAGAYAVQHGLQVNAGHGLHCGNVKPVLAIPGLHTLNIGHSVIAEAVFCGLEQAVRQLLAVLHLEADCDHAE